MKNKINIYIVFVCLTFLILSTIACKIESVTPNSESIPTNIQNPTVTLTNTPNAKTITPTISNIKTGIVINCEHLNIRQESNENSSVLLVIDKNDVVTILDKSSNNRWFFIEYDNVFGWVNSYYIQIKE